ncbi:MAG: hypothetical protein JWM10_1495 [Myxococcaceae bacterium]|nr:hypothetical protein [Myxococcaceae bacterium]
MLHWRGLAIVVTLLSAACGGDAGTQGTVDYSSLVDMDGDGYSPHGCDCNDANPTTYPGAPETSTTDAEDQNCDGRGKNLPATDADRDGWTIAGGDCVDTDPTIYPHRN